MVIHVVELPPEDLVEAGRTSELLGARVLLENGTLADWLVRSDAYPALPAPIPTMELAPVARAPKHPWLALVLLFAVMAACVSIAAFAATDVLRSGVREDPQPVPAKAIAAKPTPTPTVTAAPAMPHVVKSETKTIDVNDLPRARRR